MKYYGTIARSLIALLFVIAGVQKLTSLEGTAAYIASLGLPAPMIFTILVVLIEIPVALLFAYGYKVKEMGYLLIGFTVLTIVFAHRDFSQGANMVMALKNLAIIGGIMLAVKCASCDTCEVKKA